MKKTLQLTMTVNERGRGVFMDENMEAKINGEELAKLIKDQHGMKKGDVVCIKIISANTKYEQILFSLDKLNDILSKKVAGGVMTTRGVEAEILKSNMAGSEFMLGIVKEEGHDIPVFWDKEGKSNNPEHSDGRYDLVLYLEKERN